MAIDLQAKIPNNVDLANDPKLQRALEHWQPKYKEWWMESGPSDFSEHDIYLRTAVGVGKGGWANFDYVKMPDYRWGIFLAEPEADRKIHFGDPVGQPAWSVVPGELRNRLRRLVVTQADTEPASVEQQRLLGHTAPSLIDLRNLCQVNVEEGRHLWAMVYLLHKYFGADGRDEAEDLLRRRSGNADNPRILQAFNKPVKDWLTFFCFTAFTDRDGKYQLAALAESGFDPLARTTRFMLTEEAHHLFVGETGIGRIIQRTCEVMKEQKTEDPDKLRAHGVIDLPTLQRYLNFHFSVTLDLYGSEVSSNASSFYSMGLKGRFEEEKIQDDHQLIHAEYPILEPIGDSLVLRHVNAQQALNERLRDDYIKDCQAGVDRWNKIIEKAGFGTRLKLAHKGFHRKIGVFAESKISPDGRVVSEAEWTHREAEWLPTRADHEHVGALQGRVAEPGKFASFIAPPARGIDGKPQDFEYVRFH